MLAGFAKRLQSDQINLPDKIILCHADGYFYFSVNELPVKFTKACMSMAVIETYDGINLLLVKCENIWYYIYPTDKVSINYDACN